MAQNKTQPTPVDVDTFLSAVQPERRREDGQALNALFQRVTGKSCLYVSRLADVDLDVLGELIQAELEGLGRTWPVKPS